MLSVSIDVVFLTVMVLITSPVSLFLTVIVGYPIRGVFFIFCYFLTVIDKPIQESVEMFNVGFSVGSMCLTVNLVVLERIEETESAATLVYKSSIILIFLTVTSYFRIDTPEELLLEVLILLGYS